MELINKQITFNWMLDLRKKKIDYVERAKIINVYLHESGKSGRELAKELGVPHSTLQDWLLFSRLTNAEYEKLTKKGFSQTDIYRILRDNKNKELNIFLNKTLFEVDLEKAITLIKKHIKKPEGNRVPELIKELRNTINHAEMYINKR